LSREKLAKLRDTKARLNIIMYLAQRQAVLVFGILKSAAADFMILPKAP